MIVFILIFFVVIIVVGTISIAGFSLALRRRTKRLQAENQQLFAEPPPPPQFRSLFEPSEEEIKSFEAEENSRQLAEQRENFRQNLLARTNNADFDVLTEAFSDSNTALYQELINSLVKQSETPEKIIRLAEFISQNKLPANELLAQKVLEVWKNDQAKISVVKVLHVSALSNSAEIYARTINEIAQSWKEKKLNISGDELFSLLETHYWLLSNETRISGAGFVLKDEMANLRDSLLRKES